MKPAVLIFCAFVAFGSATQVRYDNYQVYRITPRTEEQLNKLRKLENNPAFTLWTDVTYVNRTVDVMVSPHLKNYFVKYLRDIEHNLWIEDVQERIDNERLDESENDNKFDWKNYHSLKKIHEWLEELAESNPHVTIVNAGSSYEGRRILGVKITFKPKNKIVFLEGGIHAREWIAPATTTFMLNEILNNKDPKVREVVESFNWYVFPSANPDGYEYSRTQDRLWRKTRKPNGNGCNGTDPNRNWGYKWMHGGASSNPCSDNYAGNKAFSEPETQSLSKLITSINKELVAYFSIHSFSQVLLIPFGHEGLEVPQNDAQMHAIGYKGAEALAKRYGTHYEVGNQPETIYVASGVSVDWVIGTYRNVTLGYTIELRDRGTYGFLLPPDQIIPTGLETFDALVCMLCNIVSDIANCC